MNSISGSRAFTMIELLITSTIALVLLLSAANLINRVYQGITSTKLKTHSYEISSDTIETYKDMGFSNLKVNPENKFSLNDIETSGDSFYYSEIYIHDKK